MPERPWNSPPPTSPSLHIVAVAGRLDTQTVARFSHRMGELLHAGHAQLLIEASRLSYISSAGLHAVLVATKGATGLRPVEPVTERAVSGRAS